MATSIILFIGLGILFIIFGITIPKYPQLLSGYNMMDKGDYQSSRGKKAINAIGKASMAGGFVIIISSIAYHIMKWNSGLDMIITAVILLTVICYIYQFNKLSTNKKTKIINNISFVTLIIIISAGIIYSSNDPGISIEEQVITVHGIYGTTISFKEIKNIELSGNRPPVKYRSNGFSFGNIRKGYFKTSTGEIIMLFLSAPKGPYLSITEKSGKRIFINHKDAEKTIETYNRITKQISL